MVEVTVDVAGLPPAKNEAKSMLSEGHGHARRVRALLAAVRQQVGPQETPKFPRSTDVGLEVIVRGPRPPSDATNYLGGIGDVIEVKAHRHGIEHLGELADTAIIENDSQIAEVHYRREPAIAPSYSIRIWAMSPID